MTRLGNFGLSLSSRMPLINVWRLEQAIHYFNEITDSVLTMSEEEKVGNQFEGKEKYVKDVFEDIAPYYDKMNGIMSMGMVKRWHKFMFKKAGNIKGFYVADIGCGTGEITFMASERVGEEGRVASQIMEGQGEYRNEDIDEHGSAQDQVCPENPGAEGGLGRGCDRVVFEVS